MNCNKCIHEDLCEKRIHLNDNSNQEECCQFINKECVLLLPCKIGDIVYEISHELLHNFDTYGYCVHKKYFNVMDYDRWNNFVFSTKDEANKRMEKLIELEKKWENMEKCDELYD